MKAVSFGLAAVMLIAGLFVSSSARADVDAQKLVDQVDFSEFNNIDPNHVLPDKLLKRAIAYYKVYEKDVANRRYLLVVDFTIHASESRLFVIDMKTGKVEKHHTSHGKGSDPNNTGYAKSFSNTAESKKSSVGFYLTAEIYHGKHGRSLRLDGLSKTNSNARARAVVMHGADYVSDKGGKAGRSFGCITLDPKIRDSVLDKVKGGALIYAYGGQ